MGIKEENARVCITLSKQEINAIKLLAKTLDIHYTHLIANIIKQYIEMFKPIK